MLDRSCSCVVLVTSYTLPRDGLPEAMRFAIFTKLNSTPRATFLTWIVSMTLRHPRHPWTTPRGRRKRIGRWIIAALVIVALAVVVLRMRAAPAQAVSPYKPKRCSRAR